MSKEGYYTSESNEKEPKGTIHDIKISTFTEDLSDPQSAYYTRILNESIGDLVEWAKPNIPDNPESHAGQASLAYANILNSGINELNRCLMEGAVYIEDGTSMYDGYAKRVAWGASGLIQCIDITSGDDEASPVDDNSPAYAYLNIIRDTSNALANLIVDRVLHKDTKLIDGAFSLLRDLTRYVEDPHNNESNKSVKSKRSVEKMQERLRTFGEFLLNHTQQ